MKKAFVFLLSIAALLNHFESFSMLGRFQRLSGPATRLSGLMRSAPRSDLLSRSTRFYSGRPMRTPTPTLTTSLLRAPQSYSTRIAGWPLSSYSVPAAGLAIPSFSIPSFLRRFYSSRPPEIEYVQISPDLSIATEGNFGGGKGKIHIKKPGVGLVDSVEESFINHLIDSLNLGLGEITNPKFKALLFDPREEQSKFAYHREQYNESLERLKSVRSELGERIQTIPWYNPFERNKRLSDLKDIESAIRLIEEDLFSQMKILDVHYKELIPMQEEKEVQIRNAYGDVRNFSDFGRPLGLTRNLTKEDIANFKSGRPMIDKNWKEAYRKRFGDR